MIKRILVLLLFFSLTSAGTSFAAWSDDNASEKFRNILENFETGATAVDTVNKLEKLVRTYSDAEVIDEALITLAGIYMEAKDYDNAGKAYEMLLVRFPTSVFTFDALYGLGFCQFRYGQLDEAEASLRTVVGSPGSTVTLQVKAKVLLDRIAILTASSEGIDLELYGDYAIGVVLPLSGNYAEFGEKALRGVLLAANVFGDGPGNVEVYVKDIAEGGKVAARAVTELARHKMVKGIVGPLLSANAMTVAKKAQQRRIPVLTLTQKHGVPQSGSYVFRNFLTLPRQAATLANHSFNIMEHRNYAILYPDNPYGRELAAEFKGQVEMMGGTVIGEKMYANRQADFAKELVELFAIETEEKMVGRRVVREYTTELEIDALFIPDNYDIIAQIAPYLAYYNIKEVTMLGANGWNSKTLIELARDYVQGAIFVDGFFEGSERPITKDFSDRFKDAYGYEPGLIEAESYDSAMLLFWTIYDSSTTRGEVRDKLFDITGFTGATGDIHFNLDGEAIKDLFVLTVDGRHIKEVEIIEPVLDGEGEELVGEGEAREADEAESEEKPKKKKKKKYKRPETDWDTVDDEW